MSDFSDFIANGLSDLVELAGETVTFRGEEYQADVGPLEQAPMFDMGGEKPMKNCTVVLPTPSPALTSDPRKNERMTTTQHGEMEIDTFSKSESGYVFRLKEIGGKK